MYLNRKLELLIHGATKPGVRIYESCFRTKSTLLIPFHIHGSHYFYTWVCAKKIDNLQHAVIF